MVLLPVLATPPASYRIVDLGVPPQSQAIYAVAINNRGEILVRAPWYATQMEGDRVTAFRTGHGYLWRAGHFFDFGEPKPNKLADPTEVVPTAFNDFSATVGTQGSGAPVFMSGLTDVDPFIWRGRGMDDLGAGWSSIPMAINNLGDVVGDSNSRGFVRLQGKLHGIGTLSHVPAGNRSVAVAVNDHRLVLGNSTYGGTPGKADYSLPSRPFTIDGLREPLRMRPLPLPFGNREAEGLALNREGTILLQIREKKSLGAQLVVLKGQKPSRLPRLFSAAGYQSACLNNRDEIVATANVQPYPEVTQPVLWRQGKPVVFPKFEDWKLLTATGINDKGQICGTGVHNGQTRAYLLSPN